MITHSSYVYCLLKYQTVNEDTQKWLDTMTAEVLWDTIRKLIEDNLTMSNQFKTILTQLLNSKNVRAIINQSRYGPSEGQNLLIYALLNSTYNDKYVILCTEVYNKRILASNDADNRGLGLFENGILSGINLDALYALPCNNRVDPVFLNKWLLLAYAKNTNNVLKYMIRRNIKITKPYKIMRLVIMKKLSTCRDDLKLLLDAEYNVNFPDNYGNTPIMVAKFVNNNIAIDLLLKYSPNLAHKNLKGATFYNLTPISDNMGKKIIPPNQGLTKCLKSYKIVSNISPYKSWIKSILFFILKNVLVVLLFVIYLYLQII